MDFNDELFSSIFNDTSSNADVNKMFEEMESESKKPEETPKAEEKEEEVPAAEESAPAEEPVAEAPAEEPKAEEPAAETPAEEEPAKEEAPVEEPKAEAEEEVKEETADAAEEPETAADTAAETDAASKEAVEADAPAAEETAEAEPAEPVVEVKVEKKHRRRRTKKAKTEEKAEEPKAEASEEEPASTEINEAFINNLILFIGPDYKNFRDDINDRINKIQVQPNMTKAVIDSMVSQNNELERKLMTEGQGYYDAYLSLTDKESGLMTEVRTAAEVKAEGTVAERRYAGQVALENYVWPATGEKVNLLRYANALKQITSFLDNVKSYVKSTGIALNTMRKAA